MFCDVICDLKKHQTNQITVLDHRANQMARIADVETSVIFNKAFQQRYLEFFVVGRFILRQHGKKQADA